MNNVQIENFLERSRESGLNINLNFLGSGHPASKHAGSGQPYGQYKDVYYNLKILSDKQHILILTFSGPTTLDIKKSIRSIKKNAELILTNLIRDIRSEFKTKAEMNIIINILGHSRGGVIAKEIYKWLSSNRQLGSFELGKLGIADPYAGPINRRINKNYDNFDRDLGTPQNNDVVVYTVAEKRFRDPALKLNAYAIVFTDLSHDKTKHIVRYICDSPAKEKGLFVCADPYGRINKECKRIKTSSEDPDKIYTQLDILIKGLLEPINDQNIGDLLSGRGKYRNFSYNKISSNGRRELFYTALACKFQDIVKEFLESSGHKQMWQKVERNLRRPGVG